MQRMLRMDWTKELLLDCIKKTTTLLKTNIIYPLSNIIKSIFGAGKCEKVIFLDFDGVLATEDYTDELLTTGQKIKDKFGTLFNPNCVNWLEWIISQTNAQIVITSSWKNYLSQWSIVRMWKCRNMPGEIIGVTSSFSIYRGDEIDNWLSKHPQVINYVIIDDMDYKQFRQEQGAHLVTTNHFSGLDKTSAYDSVRILNKPESRGLSIKEKGNHRFW